MANYFQRTQGTDIGKQRRQQGEQGQLQVQIEKKQQEATLTAMISNMLVKVENKIAARRFVKKVASNILFSLPYRVQKICTIIFFPGLRRDKLNQVGIFYLPKYPSRLKYFAWNLLAVPGE